MLHWLKKISKLKKDNKKLIEALYFYANPDTYFAISIFYDFPSGEFINDFDKDHDMMHIYNRAMPGKLARKTLKEIYKEK